MRLAQLALESNEHLAVVKHAKTSLSFDSQNLISKVCLITALCSINGFAQAAVLLRDVVSNDLDALGNPDDFVSLLSQIEGLGLG